MTKFVVLIFAFTLLTGFLPNDDNLSPIGTAHAKKDKGNQGKGKPSHAGGKGKSSNAGNQANTSSSDWSKDWNLNDFVKAGFSAAALYGLIGKDTSVLQTGSKPLPPGIAKQLQRGKPLPPGIAKQQAGSQLQRYLPRIEGAQWQQIGTNLVLVELGTLIVRDILTDVLN